jgi:mRNA interferase MazF
MVATDWVPERGEIIWIDCDPQKGHEQAGGRRALVLSPARYNQLTNLVVVLPITTQVKGYPFELQIPSGLTSDGVILCDQVRSLDWKARRASFKEKAPTDLLMRATALLDSLLK